MLQPSPKEVLHHLLYGSLRGSRHGRALDQADPIRGSLSNARPLARWPLAFDVGEPSDRLPFADGAVTIEPDGEF
jgi:hypothetical protein